MKSPESLKKIVLTSLLLAGSILLASAQPVEVRGHVPAAVARLKPLGRLPATNQMQLVVGLPHRNQAELDDLLVQLQDPASTNYHRWLKPDEFAARFGPTEEDYGKVVRYMEAKGFKVTGLTPNRMLVDVEAPVANVESALHINLRTYAHPTENRTFYAPDVEPTLDTNLPIVHIAGLDNYIVPHRLNHFTVKPLAGTNGITAYYTGSAPNGDFMGNDFRAAYAPGVTNRGGGQYIGIIDVGGPYYPNDLYLYETAAGLSTNIAVTNVSCTSGWATTVTTGTQDDGEEIIDITMAFSMAPDATIINYGGYGDDVFNRIATDNLAKQMTLSYGFGIDISIVQSLQQFLAQGQAMSQASGDGDADLDGGTGLTGNPYATIVGGTTLTTSGAGGPWSSETTWNWGGGGGSGGGISGYGIPYWQRGVATTANQGSAVFRSYPDVAMPADGIYLICCNGTSTGMIGGTSCASPLWAGFMALVNQQAASLGNPPVGFPNPAIYAIGKGNYSTYASIFHDITTGNNYGPKNPTRFPATSGYDVCTGWGSPRGQATINALAGVGTNDFSFYTSPDSFRIVRGGNAASRIIVSRMNGFSGSVSFTVSGLPAGVTCTVNPATTATSNILAFTVSPAAVAGTNAITITGTDGANLVHVSTLNLVIVNPLPGATPVSLPYNRAAVWTDGRTFSGGADGGGSAYSANLLGTALSWNNILFNLGPTNANDVVSCAGQVITLPAGNYTSLQLVGTAVDGGQSAQNFIITYADNSTVTNSQGFSDWAYPQEYPGESVILNIPYRNSSNGTKDQNTAVNVYNYVLPLNETNPVKSVKLPNNGNVLIFAAALANEPIPVSLAGFYNVAGIYNDHVTFTNPPLPGVDGGGYVYSGSIVPTSLIWTNTLFEFGPGNTRNSSSNGYVLSATNLNIIVVSNQTIPLPMGNYTMLRVLGAGVQGAQVSQQFSVKYTDGSSSTFVQSMSDWYSPGGYTGEAKAIATYRNGQDGNADNRTFYIYGYTFKLNSSKVTQSVKLPNNNRNAFVAAMSLVPLWAPAFTLTSFSQPDITAGQGYYGYIYTNATDMNGYAMTYGKVSGPSWLTVLGNGYLSGTPVSTNVGLNTFVVSVTDSGGLTNTANMTINVLPAPPIMPSTFFDTNNNLWVSWSGGVSPYRLQMSTNLADTNWINVGDIITSNAVSITPSNPAAFFRIMGN